MATFPPHQTQRTPREIEKEAEVAQILTQYYPEVQFFRKVLLFEYFPLTIMSYAVIHLIFYYIATTEDSLVSMLILFGVIGLVTWKVGMQVILPTYVVARKRTMGKKGKTIEKLQEEDAYTNRLAHRLAIIALNVEDIKNIMVNLHSNEPVKFLCVMSIIGTILFFIGNYVPGVIVAYLVIIFVLVWPILVHNRLPQALEGFSQILGPHFVDMKNRIIDKAKLIPRPKLQSVDIVPLSREELPTSILEQSLAFGPHIRPPAVFQQYQTPPQMMPQQYSHIPSQAYYSQQPDPHYYSPGPQDAHLRKRANLAPLAPNTPPATQREISDAIKIEDEFGRPYTHIDDGYEFVDRSQIPKNLDS